MHLVFLNKRRVDLFNCFPASESIGTDSAHPIADMSMYNSGETANPGSSIKVQRLPQNGVLWNLDRIDQRHLPLDYQYRY